MVLEKTVENPLDCKEIQTVHLTGDQSWVFIGKTDAKSETPVLWPARAKSWLIGKDSDTGRDWRQKEKGMTEDEMAGWHHWLDGPELEWIPGVGDGQGALVCHDSWGCKESDTTEKLSTAQHSEGWNNLCKLSKNREPTHGCLLQRTQHFEKCCLGLNFQWTSPGPLSSASGLQNYFTKYKFSF